MAQQALGPGSAVPRRRALFGLLDGNGWAWASVKAFAWLIIIIFLLGYLPDRAYYLTVGRTVDLGVLVWSPINLCPPTNETLPCPAPVGAVVPWETSPDRARPARAADRRRGHPGRHADPVRRRLRRDDGQRRPVVAQTVGHRELRHVGRGPAAAGAARQRQRRLRRRQHLRHRWHRRGRRADRHGLRAEPGQPDRRARRVDDRRTTSSCPSRARRPPRAITPDGLLLVGGRNADGPVDTTWKTTAQRAGRLERVDRGAASSSARRPTGRRSLIGDYLWLYGGSDANGPVEDRPARRVRAAGRRRAARQPRRGQARPSGRSTRPPTCRRRARTRRAGAPTARSTSPAATTAAVRSRRSTGPSRRPTARSPSGSTSTPATCRRRPGGRRRPSSPARTSVLVGGDDDRRHGRRLERPRQHRAAEPVLPARPRRGDRPGDEDRGRDRPAAGLPQRGRRRDGQLHHPDPDRLVAYAHKAQTRALSAACSGGAASALARCRPRAATVSPSAGRPRPAAIGPRRTGRPARSQASIPPATLTTSVRPARIR